MRWRETQAITISTVFDTALTDPSASPCDCECVRCLRVVFVYGNCVYAYVRTHGVHIQSSLTGSALPRPTATGPRAQGERGGPRGSANNMFSFK